MASISRDKGGRRSLQFKANDDKRWTIHLGKVNGAAATIGTCAVLDQPSNRISYSQPLFLLVEPRLFHTDRELPANPEKAMHAMELKKLGAALEWTDLADRQPGPGEIRVKVAACGVCRTDLHVVDGELPDPKVPIIPGHEIVGRIDAIGAGVGGLRVGARVGVPWLGHTCGVCPYCMGGQENLCDCPLFTGYTRDGGFATATIADARFAFSLG